jgi:PAS domain S-box-containing protein
MRLDTPRILIIDDDPNLRKTLSDILKFKGYETFAVENGTDGLAWLEENAASLAIIDLGLPDINGIEVLKKVKEAHPATGIIVLTGNASLDSAIDATNWGAFSYILKPYEIDLLLLNIRRAIEKQRTEEALKVSDERLKLALATSQMGVWEWDPATDNLYRSAETIAILGDSAFNWTLSYFKKMLHTDDAGCVIGAFDRAVADKTVYKVEYRIVRPDGEVRWISDIGRAEYDAEDRPIRMVGTIQDITERKQTEDALRNSEEKYRALFENSMDAILLTVPDGMIRMANMAACEMFRMTEEELIRLGRAGIADPSDRRFATALEERECTGMFFGELTYLRKDGSSFPAETSSVILDGDAGSFVILRDISERKRAEEALKVNEERLKVALAASHMGVWEWDINTDMVYRSEESNTILGRPALNWKLETFKKLLHPDDAESVIEAVNWAVVDKAVYKAEYRIVRPNGEVRWISDLGRAVYDEVGKPVRMVGTVKDITERKQTEKELIDRQNTINNMTMKLSVAEEGERCRIAEELHDQVAPKLLLCKMRIHSLADLLPDGVGNDAIESINVLIEQAISEIRSLTFQLRPPILANAGLEAALKWLAQESGENYGLMVKITDDKSFKPLKYEIRSAIFQIVRELLLNVVKHAGTQNAWISIKSSNDMIDIMVEDDGRGADLASFSYDNPKSEGFGLFNIKSKIEYLGGEMLIESSPGSGTRVFIRAPLDIGPEERG